MTITYREEVGHDLPAATIDGNFFDLAGRADRLAINPPVPLDGIADVQFAGDRIILHHNNGQSNVFVLPLQPFVWRGDWAPSTAYDAFDVFATDEGIWLARNDYTSGSTHDPDNDPVQWVFGPVAAETAPRIVSNVDAVAVALDMTVAGWYLRSRRGCTFTVPTDAEADWVDGVNFVFRQVGASPVQFSPADGVTINHNPARLLRTSAVGAVAYLRRTGSNTWDAWGDLASA